MKGKSLCVFVRFGGLDLKNQDGFKKEAVSYHSPPASRGFYAFPKIAQEFFLIGSLDKTQPDIFPKMKGDYQSHVEKSGKIKSLIRKEFVKTKGFIWHHLGEYCKPHDIILKHGSWVKTEIHIWEKAFRKMSIILRYGEKNENYDLSHNSINSCKGITGYYSKDHCEVFFDEKV